MLTTVEGLFKNGRIELIESLPNSIQEAKVLVTFLPGKPSTADVKSLNDITLSVGEWPENFSLRREDLYRDDGR